MDRKFGVQCRNPECGFALIAEEARGTVGSGPSGVGVRFGCSECGLVQDVLLSRVGYAALMIDLEGLDVAVVEESDEAGLAESEVIGRTVQGWRIDLDAVDTVDDMLLFWGYQDQVDPWSVVRERHKREFV